MPIRFRCPHCTRLLGVARRKAGTETACPHCHSVLTIPFEDEPADQQTELIARDELDELLRRSSVKKAGTAAPPKPVQAAQPANRHAPPPPPANVPPGDRPLFEQDLDAVLGKSHHPVQRPTAKKPVAEQYPGSDALSLGPEPGHIILSPQKVTALAVAMVLLMALSFAAGFWLASR